MPGTSLTAHEMQLVADAQMLITKNTIIQKVYELFGNLAEEYKKELSNKLPENFPITHPKISRGENYLGLPYVMLDFPRLFGKTDIFAVRSFFWWGNFFSITLQLSGKYYQQCAFAIENAINKNRFINWHISTAENQWEHHFESSNYVLLAEGIHFNHAGHTFLKLAKKIPLTRWDETNSFFIENFTFLIQTLFPMRQSGETSLSPGTPTTAFDL
jgi:hypothetical protein